MKTDDLWDIVLEDIAIAHRKLHAAKDTILALRAQYGYGDLSQEEIDEITRRARRRDDTR